MPERAWDSMSIDFRMTAATVVAMFDNCSAISETGLSLEVQEGRMLTLYGDDDCDDDEDTTLEYKCIITAEGSKAKRATARVAMVNVDGIHQNGRRLTIKGSGWAGRDEDGLIEVIFDEPPRMVVYDYELDLSEGDAADHANIVDFRRPDGGRGGE